jgi:filamentous hemagglutinin family protein
MSHARSIKNSVHLVSGQLKASRLPSFAMWFVLHLPALAIAAGPVPQGGSFVAGAGTIQAGSTTLDIRQATPRAVIDWRSFSVGEGHRVNVDNGSGATLSRVTGAERSLIVGKLNATGSFYLVNPQGVVIGSSGVVTTGGRFVASALDIDSDAFMKGNALTLQGDACGVVVNLGRISSSGGDVFLISQESVGNAGSIDAPRGTAELAAGKEVLLKDLSIGSQVFVQAGSHGEVIDKGAIRAAQISLQAADGNVFALAGKNGELRATGTATRDGHVWLVAEKGKVSAHGRIGASNADGSGGTVDTNARMLSLDYVAVDAGQWNLRTPAFIAGRHNASMLARNLSNGTSITVDKTDPHGDIEVRSDLRWSGNASLELNAGHSVTIGRQATIANTGSGNLTLRADAAGFDNAGSVINRGTIDWSKSVGIVSTLYDMNGSYAAGTMRSSPAWHGAPFSGLKTQVSAYRVVNSVDDLLNIAHDLGGSYALGKDIDASRPSAIAPLGLATRTSFTGQFDGRGHVISNLSIYNISDGLDDTGYTGLFAVIGKTGVVRDLDIKNGGAGSFVSPTGILAGRNDGLITYVRTSGSISTGDSFSGSAGGLVGINNGIIERSGSTVDVSFSGGLGGLVSQNNGLILQSYADGSSGGGVHASAGGLAAGNSGTIRQSYATGSAGALSAGGLVDYNDGRISESFAAASLGFTPYPGGVVSTNTGSVAGNVFWDRQVAGTAVGVFDGTPVPAANGLSTAQMSVAASFGPAWDFGPNGVWVIPAGATHPILRWQLEH